MREIKFSYMWKSENKSGDLWMEHIYTLEQIEAGNKYDVTNFKLIARRQYTGLKDKHGVEVYEGDILILEHNNFGPLEVKWHNNDCMYEAVSGDPKSASCIDSTCTIIGNIYQNPELLENDND